ncbi:MAG: DEAD/DEAH box helicase [Candidatus Diapherotrites archaeon]|nr:DEAD/DEAH box helicase [Candidatus Diapherotrites archaeon]
MDAFNTRIPFTDIMTEFMEHPLLKSQVLEKRAYQVQLAQSVLEKGSTLIVAPTALGKTVIAAIISALQLEARPNESILVLAPTKPLAVQHQKSFRAVMNFPEEQITLLTGAVPALKRKKILHESKIICATPQTIESELAHGKFSLQNTSLIVFDEAHRGVKDYSYVFVAKQFIQQQPNPLIVGLTASPGSAREQIQDVCRNLFLTHIEVRTALSPDVSPYTQETTMEWRKVQLPARFEEIREHLHAFMEHPIELLKKMGLLFPAEHARNVSRKRLIEIQVRIRKELSKPHVTRPAYFSAASMVAALIKTTHAIDLLETQGIAPLHIYLQSLAEKSKNSSATKSAQKMMQDPSIRQAVVLTQKAHAENQMHPKLIELKKILTGQFRENPDSRVLVFNHYRDSIEFLENFLAHSPPILASKFIGQADRGTQKGMNQKQQILTLQEFREGKYNTLLCTSVAEEGLDIPAVDLVVFFEPIPSEIRFIQRRGRTGRAGKGKTIILMTEKTRDEAYYWAAIGKEKRMHSTLKSLQKTASLEETMPAQQKTLTPFLENVKNKVLVYVDARERLSPVARQLEELGAMIHHQQLDTADYVLTDEIACERKTTEDFLESLLDGRLFSQAKHMASQYTHPFIIIEGNPQDLFVLRNIHKNAILGALTSIALEYGVPLFFSSGPRETAEYIYVTAKREQLGKEKDVRLRSGKKGFTLAQQQQFLIESLPRVGPQLAKSLLEHFKTPAELFNAGEKKTPGSSQPRRKKSQTNPANTGQRIRAAKKRKP